MESLGLDLALQREGFLAESEPAMRWCEAGNSEVTFVAWHTVTNVILTRDPKGFQH